MSSDNLMRVAWASGVFEKKRDVTSDQQSLKRTKKATCLLSSYVALQLASELVEQLLEQRVILASKTSLGLSLVSSP